MGGHPISAAKKDAAIIAFGGPRRPASATNDWKPCHDAFLGIFARRTGDG
jgi:hypothetical protein